MDLKEIQKPVEPLLSETTLLLKEKVKSDINLLRQISGMTPVGKGKKIRSTLLFLLAGMRGVESAELSEIAASIEMFHLSSLIHDDIMDNSELRRGQKTLNTFMGNFRSVVWGDYLFINSFTALHSLRKPDLMDIVFKAAKLMVEGQIIEVENSFSFDVKMETYYDIINRKTSSLFAAVTEIVSTMSGDSPEEIEAYYNFGLDFGAIFQVRDDMLDIFSGVSGKDRFRDLYEGKITLPYILLMEQSQRDIRKDFVKGRFKKLLKAFEQYNIQDMCLERIDGFHRKCLEFLDRFPPSEYKESLLKLMEFIRYRDY